MTDADLEALLIEFLRLQRDQGSEVDHADEIMRNLETLPRQAWSFWIFDYVLVDWKLDLSWALTGRVGFRQIDPGNIVHATDPNGIVTIVKLQPISVVFTAPEEHVQSINKALDAGQVPVWALSSDGTKTLAEGHLAIVNNQVDLASGTIQMKATFENKNNVLWPGLSVLTRLQLEMLKQRRCRAERSRKAWAGRAVRVCDRCPEQGERASNQSEPRRRYDQSGSERADAGRSHRCRGTIPAHPGGIG